jgi:serralysin
MASPTTWERTSSVFPTANPYLNGLLGGMKWGGPAGTETLLTYSFPGSDSWWSTDPVSGYGPFDGGGEPWNASFRGLFPQERAIVERALSAWSGISGLDFLEVADSPFVVGDLRFGFTTDATAHAYFPFPSAKAGDTWFGRHLDFLGQSGSYAFATVLHEIGHALGLKHPHEESGGFNALPIGWDSLEFSIMSYRSYVGAPSGGGYRNEFWGHAQSPMIYDIAAIQHLYGADYSTRSGNTVYRWNPFTGEAFVDGAGHGAPGANRVFETVWDGGGIDTYDFSNYATNLRVDLGPGSWSLLSNAQLAELGDGRSARANVFNAFLHEGDPRSLIENAVGGAGSDVIVGNFGSNGLSGNGGGDRLVGLAGNDALWGGTGKDVLVGGWGRDAMTGGPSSDIFDFNHVEESGRTSSTRDVIHDFRRRTDDIDLRGIDSNTNAKGNNKFAFVGFGAFSDTPGELRLKDVGRNLIVQADVNGDGRSDFELLVKNVPSLKASDFLL